MQLRMLLWLFGPIGGKIVTIGILISVYGALNGYTMTGIRIPYALALDNLMPFSRQFQSCLNALLFLMLLEFSS